MKKRFTSAIVMLMLIVSACGNNESAKENNASESAAAKYGACKHGAGKRGIGRIRNDHLRIRERTGRNSRQP